MVVKINKKTITVTDETAREKDIDWVYLAVSTTGYLFIFWFMDYVCYTFFGIRAIPFIHVIGDVLSWVF